MDGTFTVHINSFTVKNNGMSLDHLGGILGGNVIKD